MLVLSPDERRLIVNTLLVNAKNTNNGIMYYGRKTDFDFSNMTLDIVQNGASAVGNVYLEVQDTGVLEDAYLIKLKSEIVSPSILCYLATVIGRCVKQYFSYDDKCTWDRVKEKYILLPVTQSGKPDWKYMEQYMKGLESKAKSNFIILSA